METVKVRIAKKVPGALFAFVVVVVGSLIKWPENLWCKSQSTWLHIAVPYLLQEATFQGHQFYFHEMQSHVVCRFLLFWHPS